MYIGLDFDGTVVKHDYPYIGEDIGAVPVLKKLVEAGHKLILCSMRGTETNYGDRLTPAVKWFEEHEIPLFGVNENPTQNRWTNSKKPYANLYIDDAGIGTPCKVDDLGNRYVDWEKVEELLKKYEIL